MFQSPGEKREALSFVMRKLELVSVAMLVWLLPLAAVNKVEGGSQAKPGCSDKCGNVTIKYPFGYGTDDKGGKCSLAPAFEVDCTNKVPFLLNAHPSKMFNILEIKFPNKVLLESNQTMAVECTPTNKCANNVSFDLGETFKVSAQANRFRSMGCDTTASINNTDGSFTSRCDTQWMISSGAKKHGGLGQCQMAVPEGSSGYTYSVMDQHNVNSACNMTCSFAVLAAENFDFPTDLCDSYLAKQRELDTSIRYPLMAEWAINVSSCNSNNNNSDICGENAWCNNTVGASGLSGFHCYCKKDCEGNPYLNGTDGCGTGESPFPTAPVAKSPFPTIPVAIGFFPLVSTVFLYV